MRGHLYRIISIRSFFFFIWNLPAIHAAYLQTLFDVCGTGSWSDSGNTLEMYFFLTFTCATLYPIRWSLVVDLYWVMFLLCRPWRSVLLPRHICNSEVLIRLQCNFSSGRKTIFFSCHKIVSCIR